MDARTPHRDGPARRWLEWVARVGSLVSLAVIAMFAFGEAEPVVAPTVSEWVLLACFPGLVAIGMLLGWWRPRLGGVVTLGGLVAFLAVHGIVADDWWPGPWFAILSAPGLLFLLVGFWGTRARPGETGRPRAGGGQAADA